MPGYANPQNLNRYSYVTNNPLRYTDPTGHMMTVGDGGGGGSYTLPTLNINYCTTHPKSCGGETGGGGNHDSPTDPPGHSYTLSDPICLDLPWINCTQEEAAEYMTMFQYPGQWPGSPVEDGHNYNVWPAEVWSIPTPLCYIGMCDSGAITVDISDHDPLIIRNITTSSHIFNVGDVVRQGKQDEHGNWHVVTHGEGTNDGYGILPGPFLDAVNQNIGPIVFHAEGVQMVIYTTVVETGQYISPFLP